MSYSFSVTAESKGEAGLKVRNEMAKVVQSQPVHDADARAVEAAAEMLIGMLRDPGDGQCVYVNVSGSLSWREAGVFTAANVSVSTWVSAKI